MALIVQKFGGSSLANLDCINHVATKILQTCQQGHQVVVIVSAMHGETDRLINLAKSIHPEPHAREYDVLLATGEQASMALLTIALIRLGCSARSYSGAQACIYTNGVYKKARIIDIQCDAIRKDLAAGNIPVIAGFQGIDHKGDINTLGRGGSDTTAVAVAAALNADECQIFTDVDGIYSADPSIVPEARLLKQIHFEEVLELASMGAKVLQQQSVEYAGKFKVPLRVLSTFSDGPGTLVTFARNNMSNALVSGVACKPNQAKIVLRGIDDKPGIAGKILAPISHANIDVDMILQTSSLNGKTDFIFTIPGDDYVRGREIVDELSTKIDIQEILGNDKIGKLSLIGVGMQSHAGIASKMLETLGNENINIQMISTSEIKISVVIEEQFLDLGAKCLHTAFALGAS